MTALLAVAAGGALGAVGRYIVIGRVGARLGTDFPYGTLVVNVVGSFLLGLVVTVVAKRALDDSVLLFLGVGTMGGFTTFSTFALDVAYLAGRHARPAAAVYVVVSVVASIGAFAAGFVLASSLP